MSWGGEFREGGRMDGGTGDGSMGGFKRKSTKVKRCENTHIWKPPLSQKCRKSEWVFLTSYLCLPGWGRRVPVKTAAKTAQ